MIYATILAIASAPLVAAVAPTQATLGQEAAKAIGSKMRESVVMKLGKRINKRGGELAQFPAPPAAGGWTVVQPSAASVGSAGAAGAAGTAGAAAGLGGAGIGAAGGIGIGAAAAAAGVAAAAAVGVAVAASTSSSNDSPIISVSP